MRNMKRIISLVLVLALFISPLVSSGLADAIARPQGGGAVDDAYWQFLFADSENLTWAQGAKRICALLGYLIDDAADIDFEAYADQISGLNADDDSVYLAILAQNGYLSVTQPIDPMGVMPLDAYALIMRTAFSAVALDQEAADALAMADGIKNVVVAGDGVSLKAFKLNRVAVGQSERLTLSGTEIEALSVIQRAKLYIARSKLGRVYIDTPNEPVYLHVGGETEIPVIAVRNAGDVVIEGSGALGIVRVMGEVASLTMRATGSVVNDTEAEITVTGPQGVTATIAPSEQADFTLTQYLVSFVTEGTPVATQEIAPGGTVDFRAAQTELDGKIFTAWYENADYTLPYSMLRPVDKQLTLYARFIDEADAAIVTFVTFGGYAIEPMTFAKGEYLLCKPTENLYTSKDGFAFGGWCVDEECTIPFGYTDIIQESMTLYAMFVSDEVQEEEKGNNIAELPDLDWRDAIKLTAPEGMSAEDVSAHVAFEAGTGGVEPEIAYRETSDGFELYATHYREGDETGFEPGATFSLTVSGGVMFADYPAEIETLVVTVYREEVSIVEFTEGLTYVLWQDVSEYVPVDSSDTNYEMTFLPDGSVDEQEYESMTTPGSLLLSAGIELQPDEIVVFYDGDIADDENSITAWRNGSLESYVLFAQIVSTHEEAGKTRVLFKYADPNDYLEELDVHITRDVNVEDQITEEDVARVERSIREQVSSNEELRASMLMSVMTSSETQDQLDEMYGKGVYSLAAMSAEVQVNPAVVKLSISGNSVTASITVSATIQLKEGGTNLAMVITPKLTFEEKLSLSSSVSGGNLWIDASITVRSTTTIRLEITAKSGDMDTVLSDAKSTLEKIITPGGLDDTMDYIDSLDTLMVTMNELLATNIEYKSLYEEHLFTAKVSFKGIVTLQVDLDLLGQVGIIATFGIELIVESAQKIGFKYNFLKFSGNSYKEKLAGDVRTQIYLIGKVGVRVGLRVTISITVCAIAKTSISGILYAYAELTGMFFYTASLITGDSTYFGAMYFEVGLDASITLSFEVNLLIYTYKKSWTLWKERWKLWSMEKSSTLVLMDNNELEKLWAASIDNARGKIVFGFNYAPMKTYTFSDVKCVDNQLLWDSKDGREKLKLEILNLRINGELTAASDPRNAVVIVGDGSKGRARGKIYIDEMVAAEHLIELVECDVKVTYEDNAASALVKKQELTLPFAREMTLATNTVNVQIALYDWCAHAWGISAAEWDGAVVYEQRLVNAHVLGMLVEPSKTERLDLASITRSAIEQYPDIEDISLSYYNPTRNNINNAMVYGIPRVSNLCYMTPDNGTIRYDIYPQTRETTITWYIYASRFPGYSGDIEYVVRAPMLSASNNNIFSVIGGEAGASMRFAPVPDQSKAWNLVAHRSAFDGSDRPIMLSVDGSPAAVTGLMVNGREAAEKVELSLSDTKHKLDIALGEGVTGYKLLSPALSGDGGITPGTRVQLSVTTAEDYRNIVLSSQPEGLAYTAEDGIVTFIMPVYPVKLTLTAYKVRRIVYDYNYGDMGRYLRVYVAENETLYRPNSPVIDKMTFRGWYTEPECVNAYNFGRRPTRDLTLYADWTCDVTIDFGDAMGQALYLKDGLPELIFEDDEKEYRRFTYSTLRVGESPLEIVLPNYSDYDFMGWHIASDYSDAPIDMADYTLRGGVTFRARWVKFVSVSYQLNYDDAGEYFFAMEHQGLPLQFVPQPPVREHYTFNGWYTHSNAKRAYEFDPDVDLPQEDLILYAGWIPNAFAIEYDLAGGENNSQNPSEYTVESGDITLAAPTRAGYDFAGWTGTELDAPTLNVVIPAGAHVERSYTATWTVVDYPITYDLVRGALSSPNPGTYTIEDDDIVLNNPVMEKYDFMGWIGTELAEPTIQVTIPTGSIGARSYTATWTTDDPAEQIADYALAAVADSYTYDIDAYASGASADSSIYLSARAGIDSNANSAPYAGDISLELTAGDAVESDTRYAYTFTAQTTYTDDAGNALTREKKVTAFVLKRVPVINSALSAMDITYGQTLAESALVNASATYNNADVPGSFAWSDATIVPLGANNGDAMYTVVFTPEDTSNFAKVSADIAVNTQIGVAVSITADDRDYIAGSTEAAGAVTLTDKDTSASLTDIALAGGSWNFAQAAPGDELTVTYTGYSLTTPSGDEDLYVLLDTTATAKASIFWITPALTPPTATVKYGQTLSEVALSGGSAVYNGAQVPGSWAWKDESQTPSSMDGLTAYVVYTPKDTIGYKTVEIDITVTVEKGIVNTVTLDSKKYSREKQFADVPESNLYTVKTNKGGTDAGKYEVVLTLSKPHNYRWSNDENGTNPDYATFFEITPVDIEVSGTASVRALGYGQRLSKGDSVGDTQISAADMISGLVLKYKDVAVTGKWVWNLTSAQEGILNASDPNDSDKDKRGSGYQVSATFKPTYNNFNTLTRTFTVVVQRSTPDLSGCTLSCSSILLTNPRHNRLNQSKITCTGAPKNPVTKAEVAGSWAWSDDTRVPTPNNKKFNAVFHPSDDDNYLDAYSKELEVPFHDKITIKVDSMDYLPGDNGGLYLAVGNYLYGNYTYTDVTPNQAFSIKLKMKPITYDGKEYDTYLGAIIIYGIFNGEYSRAIIEYDYEHNVESYYYTTTSQNAKVTTTLSMGSDYIHTLTIYFDSAYIVTGNLTIETDAVIKYW